MAQLLFPYLAGEQFVARLLRSAGATGRSSTRRSAFRPPASTEQIMHPQAYLEVEQPERVSVRGPAAALGAGWREIHGGTLGEWLTQRLLARAGGTGAADAAAGWGGDRYALLGDGDERALVARWTWDSPRDADEFAAALRAWGAEGLPGAEPAGRGRLAHAGGGGGRGAPRRRAHPRPGALGRARAPRRARGLAFTRPRAGSSAVRAAGS